jgi:hypothetical protein
MLDDDSADHPRNGSPGDVLDDESAGQPQNDDSPAGGINDVHHPLDNIHVEIERHLSAFKDETIGLNSEIEDIQIAAEFIEELKHAKLDDSNMLPEDIARLREAPKDFRFAVDDPDFRFSLRTFLATSMLLKTFTTHFVTPLSLDTPKAPSLRSIKSNAVFNSFAASSPLPMICVLTHALHSPVLTENWH